MPRMNLAIISLILCLDESVMVSDVMETEVLGPHSEAHM
jgi:hypothetical protein